MDLVHIKLFGHSKEMFSIVYSINKNHQLSHFVKAIDNLKMLDRPGIDPTWMSSVLKIQESDLNHAKKYVLYRIKEAIGKQGRHISVGFSWDQSNFHHDNFINEIIKLSELSDGDEDKDI